MIRVDQRAGWPTASRGWPLTGLTALTALAGAITPDRKPHGLTAHLAAMKQQREDPMKTFTVTVERQVTQTVDLEIEAEDIDEARERAEDEILNLNEDDWDNDGESSDPDITKVVEMSDDDEASDEDNEDAKTSDEESEVENEAV